MILLRRNRYEKIERKPYFSLAKINPIHTYTDPYSTRWYERKMMSCDGNSQRQANTKSLQSQITQIAFYRLEEQTFA